MKKIGIVLANELRDVDLFIPLSLWRKAKIMVDLISLEKKNSVMMESGTKVSCNTTFDVTNMSQYNALYFPGGIGIERFYPENWPVKDPNGPIKLFKTLESFRLDKSKYILVTANSSRIIHSNKLLGNSVVAGFSNDYVRNDVQEKIVNSHNLVSVIGYYALTDFALYVIEILQGSDVKDNILQDLELGY